MVPKTAKVMIVPKLLKNLKLLLQNYYVALSRENPAANIIGGKRRRKKASTSKANVSLRCFVSLSLLAYLRIKPKAIPSHLKISLT
jgi:hypothetical protein